MDPKLCLSGNNGEPLVDASWCKRLIERSLYVVLHKPKIAFIVQKLNPFISSPREPHLNTMHNLQV